MQYRQTLEHLSRQPGMLGEIFKKARPDIQNPATLKRLIVDLIVDLIEGRIGAEKLAAPIV